MVEVVRFGSLYILHSHGLLVALCIHVEDQTGRTMPPLIAGSPKSYKARQAQPGRLARLAC